MEDSCLWTDFKNFWDLIPPWWIIGIVFYKIVYHIIFRKIFAYLNMSNSGLFSFPFFVPDQSQRTTQVSMWLKRWTKSRTKKCEIRIHWWCVCGRSEFRRSIKYEKKFLFGKLNECMVSSYYQICHFWLRGWVLHLTIVVWGHFWKHISLAIQIYYLNVRHSSRILINHSQK